MIKRLTVLSLLFLLVFPLSAYAGIPLDTVKGHVNSILDVLRDPAFKGESAKKMKKEKIRVISEKMFDFTELSRRTLGQNWNKFNASQQKDFIELYRSILEDAYVDKIISYTDEKVSFNKENTLTEKTTEVQTTIITKKADIPISYRVISRGDTWRVYDVVIEGVSLISNYRSQFKEILMNKTPDALLDTLRKKVGKA
ncbi:MAG: ABC transporter substrate-binding protein [Thermodesulfovibrionales bacterium]|nr:ABC transporter substrate-binding protein [Thermodesulfovibrionales bacterium]